MLLWKERANPRLAPGVEPELAIELDSSPIRNAVRGPVSLSDPVRKLRAACGAKVSELSVRGLDARGRGLFAERTIWRAVSASSGSNSAQSPACSSPLDAATSRIADVVAMPMMRAELIVVGWLNLVWEFVDALRMFRFIPTCNPELPPPLI